MAHHQIVHWTRHANRCYQEMEVNTANQIELILLLYNGAIHHLNLAKQHALAQEIDRRGAAISRAVALICELQTSLDPQKGKDIAANLARLYDYMLRRLTLANIKGEVEPITEVMRLLSNLASAWKEVNDRQMAAPAGGEVRTLQRAAV